MNFSSKQRRRPSTVRAISIAPPKTSSRSVLSSIMDDMIPHIAVGFRALDPDGKPAHIFLDFLGFLADFKEAADNLDCLSLSADAGCNMCTFRKKKNREHSVCAYSTALHSKNTSTSRSVLKHRQMRDAGISENDCNFLGIRNTSQTTRFNAPFVYLEEKLRSFRPGPGSLCSPVTPLYSAYGTSIVAPDHCIMGNIRRLMTIVLRSLPNAMREAFIGLLNSSRVDNGFADHANMFNETTSSLKSTTFSTHYATWSLFEK